MPEVTVYDQLGGGEWFVALVDRFYVGVASDFLLRPLYPDDLTDSRDHMAKFLIQYWGGPTTYSDERGHPRLRMRHAPFVISDAERDAWLGHMLEAVAAGGASPEIEQQIVDYFSMASTQMINTAPLR